MSETQKKNEPIYDIKDFPAKVGSEEAKMERLAAVIGAAWRRGEIPSEPSEAAIDAAAEEYRWHKPQSWDALSHDALKAIGSAMYAVDFGAGREPSEEDCRAWHEANRNCSHGDHCPHFGGRAFASEPMGVTEANVREQEERFQQARTPPAGKCPYCGAREWTEKECLNCGYVRVSISDKLRRLIGQTASCFGYGSPPPLVTMVVSGPLHAHEVLRDFAERYAVVLQELDEAPSSELWEIYNVAAGEENNFMSGLRAVYEAGKASALRATPAGEGPREPSEPTPAVTLSEAELREIDKWESHIASKVRCLLASQRREKK